MKSINEVRVKECFLYDDRNSIKISFLQKGQPIKYYYYNFDAFDGFMCKWKTGWTNWTILNCTKEEI